MLVCSLKLLYKSAQKMAEVKLTYNLPQTLQLDDVYHIIKYSGLTYVPKLCEIW